MHLFTGGSKETRTETSNGDSASLCRGGAVTKIRRRHDFLGKGSVGTFHVTQRELTQAS